MAYEVITGCFFRITTICETKEEVIYRFWSAFYDGTARDIRIRDLYDHQRVDIEGFFDVFNRVYSERVNAYQRRLYGEYEFRRGPVKGTGKSHRWRKFQRSLRTKQEMRENDFLQYDEDAKEYGIRTRGARAKLPTAWDDQCRSDMFERSWKNSRRTQWKGQ